MFTSAQKSKQLKLELLNQNRALDNSDSQFKIPECTDRVDVTLSPNTWNRSLRKEDHRG